MSSLGWNSNFLSLPATRGLAGKISALIARPLNASGRSTAQLNLYTIRNLVKRHKAPRYAIPDHRHLNLSAVIMV